MYQNKRIAIILSDTLRSLGLQNLLTEYFSPVEVHLFTSFGGFVGSGNSDSYDYYCTDSDTLVINSDFFLPRKCKTLVLVGQQEKSCVSVNRLYVRSPKETIIEQFQDLFNNESSNSSIENNKDLSSREIEVLQLIVKGITNKEIADKLNISLNTVLTHRKNLTSKLGIKTVSGLTFYAIMNGLISGDEITL